MTNVTLVTHDATLDALSVQDYREIYDELRGRDPVSGAYVVSLDKFVTLVTSTFSKAQWSKYQNGEITLTRAMRNELRLAVGQPALPATIAEATASASPDAAVWQVGDGPADHVIMVTAQEPITIHVNGAVSVDDGNSQEPCSAHVTEVTRAKTARRYSAARQRKQAQNTRRLALGKKWDDVIEAGLIALEQGENYATQER